MNSYVLQTINFRIINKINQGTEGSKPCCVDILIQIRAAFTRINANSHME